MAYTKLLTMLKGAIFRKGGTPRQVATQIDMSIATLYRRLDAPENLSLRELAIIHQRWGVPKEKILAGIEEALDTPPYEQPRKDRTRTKVSHPTPKGNGL